MQIKKFEAQNVADALKLIKQEFGSNAVIISVRKIENGKRVFGFQKASGVEVTAATDMQNIDGKDKFYQGRYSNYSGYPDPPSDSVLSKGKRNLIKSFREGTKRFEIKNDSIRLNVQKGNRDTKELFSSYHHMLEQDVDEEIALDLVKEVSRFASSNNYLCKKGIKPYLVQILDEQRIAAGRVKIAKDKQKIVAAIGPTGVGKTTTIAKLAAAAKKRKKRKSVALITLDENRIGAIEQIRVYAKIIRLPFRVASNKKELKSHVDMLSSYDIIFIDTPGVSQAKRDQIHEVQEAFTKIQDVEFHLVMSAATNEKTLKDVMEKFKVFQLSRLIFTKLDESITYGSMLNQLYRSKIPVSYFTNGQNVPEDIEAATIEKLVDMVFEAKEDRKFLSGSPEELALNITQFEKLLNGSEKENELLHKPEFFENPKGYNSRPSAFVEKRFSGYRG